MDKEKSVEAVDETHKEKVEKVDEMDKEKRVEEVVWDLAMRAGKLQEQRDRARCLKGLARKRTRLIKQAWKRDVAVYRDVIETHKAQYLQLSDETRMLRAQVAQCTTAMLDASVRLRECPDFVIARECADALYAARATPVPTDAPRAHVPLPDGMEERLVEEAVRRAIEGVKPAKPNGKHGPVRS